MTPKEVIFSPEAERAIKKLTQQEQKIAMGALRKLRSGEGKLLIEKIKTQPSFFRLKVAHIRIIYYPLTKERVVLLLIGDRKSIYRKIANLDQRLETALKKLKLAT